MLTSQDDTLWHQLPTTFDHVGTSDPRFFDRYWFACYEPNGNSALQMTMGVYRNMNVLDAGFAVTHAGRQYNVRASRSLGREIATVCGPFAVEVTRPLQEFKIKLDGGEHGIEGEIVWQGIAPAAEEKHHFSRLRSRISEDYHRFNQIGRADGWLRVAGTDISLRDWWACRDHSWGVRPRMGTREPVTGLVVDLETEGFVFAFLFLSADTLVGHLQLGQRGNGEKYVSGDLRRRSDLVSQEVTAIDLETDLHPGTRRFTQCTLRVSLADGQTLTLRCRAIGASIAMQGLGYSGGFNDNAGLGVWRGQTHLEYDVWDVSSPATIVYPDGKSKDHWHRIQPVSIVEPPRRHWLHPHAGQ